jgi:hypothetical protein
MQYSSHNDGRKSNISESQKQNIRIGEI